MGAAVTSALRSTIATVGVVIGYLLLGEALLRGIFGYAIEPWLASSRVFAFVRPRLVITDYNGIRPAETVLNMWPSAPTSASSRWRSARSAPWCSPAAMCREEPHRRPT
jgi:hypothetical protein